MTDPEFANSVCVMMRGLKRWNMHIANDWDNLAQCRRCLRLRYETIILFWCPPTLVANPMPLQNILTCRGDFAVLGPEAIGDYVGGPNHVLPTARSTRFSSILSV